MHPGRIPHRQLLHQGGNSLSIAENHELAVSVDTMVAGIHFPPETMAENVGHKALAINISDMAAMGAEPLAVNLSLILPEQHEAWHDKFMLGFHSLAKRFAIRLLSTTQHLGELSITAQIYGQVPAGKALRRDGAIPGDGIYVTGTLGEAGLALCCLQGKLKLSSEQQHLLQKRLERPEPRINAGMAIRNIATSAIDLSDGLCSDLGHILKKSGTGATIHTDKLPLSSLGNLENKHIAALRAALCAGDDYELCFTVPANKEIELEQHWNPAYGQITRIGIVDRKPGLRCLRADGSEQPFSGGYEHFTQ